MHLPMKNYTNHSETITSNHAEIQDQIDIINYLQTEDRTELIKEIFNGLRADQKHISSRFFYDQKGSQLFEKITELSEYYPTRTEKTILSHAAKNIISHHDYPDIIELGSGDCSKVSILLEAFGTENLEKIKYFPVDVSESAVVKSANELVEKYPGLKVHGILADFMKHMEAVPGSGNSLICFFGSTLGNLGNDLVAEFICSVKRSMTKGDSFLLGLDMVKDRKTLTAAYNDEQSVTAAFNKNILSVVNRIAKTNFNEEDFAHIAFFNEQKSRIEMHLKALRDIAVNSPLIEEELFIREGETIHTENSRKFTLEDIRELANVSGLSIQGIYTDKHEWFSLVHLICTG